MKPAIAYNVTDYYNFSNDTRYSGFCHVRFDISIRDKASFINLSPWAQGCSASISELTVAENQTHEGSMESSMRTQLFGLFV